MEKKKFQSVSIAALIVSILPLVNSFEFHSCERTPQVDCLLR